MAKKIHHIDGNHREFMNSTILQTSNSAFLYLTTPLEIIDVV